MTVFDLASAYSADKQPEKGLKLAREFLDAPGRGRFIATEGSRNNSTGEEIVGIACGKGQAHVAMGRKPTKL